MIDQMPAGKLIGTMEAPLPWIFSHTARFVGIVRIKIQDGEGFILIDRGKARSCYFQHGHRVLLGHAAKDYFSTQPLIRFSMYMLTPKEFSSALSIAGIAGSPDGMKEPDKEPAPPTVPVIRPQTQTEILPPVAMPPPEPQTAFIPVEQQPVTPSVSREKPPDFSGHKAAFPAKDSPHSEGKDDGDGGVQAVPPVPPDSGPGDLVEKKFTFEQHPVRPKTAKYPVEEFLPETDMRMIAQIMLGRIKTLQGVIAVLIFNKDMKLVSIGDVNLESLVAAAEDMLMTVGQLDSIMEWGSFVQMTLQIPGGNVIIAPFFDEYLCILTSPDINLGQVRRILREIKAQQVQ
ncbi:MAG: roadblock/LC7 domain-containing protein [Methanoregula sp.]|nr:MAG: roadblock/LC7 domain-containing protein [Methanoregula sp.]